MAKKGLGRGLDSLIPNVVGDDKKSKEAESAPAKSEVKTTDGITKVEIIKVEPNRKQPRKNFNEDALAELADSIKQYGIIEPVVVQDRKDHYEIIAGERRWRAAKIAGLKEIPVVIKNYTDEEILLLSLLENIQREDLNPIEEAETYERLISEFGFTQDQVADKVSKNRSTVTNSLRLLKLAPPVRQMLIDKKLSTGHARALLAVEDPDKQFELAEQSFDQKLSVRDIEKIVKNLSKPAKPAKASNEQLELHYRALEEKLKQAVGSKVAINGKGDGTGSLTIEFYSNDDLDRIADRLQRD